MGQLTRINHPDPDLLHRLKEFQVRVRQVSSPRKGVVVVPSRGPLSGPHADILLRLRKHSPELADSLEQALTDLNDGSRLTYVGPAGEAREVMRATVQLFAPDDEVRQQSWFVGIRQGNQTNPSQSERLRFAVQQRGGNYVQASEAIDLVDERVSRIGRHAYQRASAAFHNEKQQQEVRKTMGYVFAVLDDVLPE